MLRRVLSLGGVAALAVSCGSSGSPAPVARPKPPLHATAEQNARAQQLLTGPDWYRHAVFYEVDVRSFQDSNGDGIGDLDGLRSRLDYLKDLGVDALWLMPIMPSPFFDSGYDVADYRAIDPAYGTMQSFDALLAAAKDRGMRVMIDLVLNHTSDKHAWFQESRADKTNPKADWYVWSDTPSRADIGCGSYNQQFGPTPWTLDATRGQYYFHRFYPQQPDLNYRNPAVVQETLDIARFWLDKGVAGFRCDVIGLLYESAAGCSMIPETKDYIRKLRGVLDAYPERAMVAEPTDLQTSIDNYGSGSDMFHMAFNFSSGYFWSLSFTSQNRKTYEDSFRTALGYPKGAQEASVIGSHDVNRAWTSAQQIEWRYLRAVEIQMTMRATPFIYYGEEVGLRPGHQVVVDSRDSARTPMPWTRAGTHGFTTGAPWIAFGEAADETSVEAEDARDDSILAHYRRLLAFRRGHSVWGTGDFTLVAIDNPALLAFVRSNAEESYLVVVNLSEDAQDGVATDGVVTSAGSVVWGDAQIALDAGTLRVKVPATGSAIAKLR